MSYFESSANFSERSVWTRCGVSSVSFVTRSRWSYMRDTKDGDSRELAQEGELVRHVLVYIMS